MIKALNWPVRALAALAATALLAMLALIVADLMLGWFNASFTGTTEVVGLLAALVTGLALADAQRTKSHIAIDLVMSRLPMRVQLAVGIVIAAASIVIFVVLAQQMWAYGMTQRETGSVTESLGWEYWPLPLMVAVGAGGVVLALLADGLQAARQLTSSDPQGIW